MLLALILLHCVCLESPVDAQSLQTQGVVGSGVVDRDAVDRDAAKKISIDIVSPGTGIVGGDEQAIHAILSQHCFDCHGGDEVAAALRLDSIDLEFRGVDAETWHDVLNQVNRGEMPPEEQPEMTSESRQKLTGWIQANLDRVARERKGDRSQTVLRRLTRYEYNNTLCDLLGIDLNYVRDFPPEPSSEDGFKNNGAALGISALQVEYYLAAARYALEKAIVEGPPPQVHRHRFEQTSPASSRNDPPVGNRMLPGSSFLAKMLEYPREGQFIIRAMAGATIPDGMGIPRMRVSLGLRSDTQSPSKVVGEVDVANPEAQQKLFEFRGRIEEYPLPGHNPKFPGITITLSNVHEDGIKTPKQQRYKAIALTSEQKRIVGDAVKNNVPKLPVATEGTDVGQPNAAVTSSLSKLQRQVEELRLLPADHSNQTDLAYRLYDLEREIENESKLLADHAEKFGLNAAEFLERYREANAPLLVDREQILNRFDGIPRIDRKTKQMVPEEPVQPRSTLVLNYLEFEAPVYSTWPPEHHTRLLPPSDLPERERAERAIESLMSRAYRRPVSESDVRPVLSFYDEIRHDSPSFEEAMRETLAMVLISPEFLYLFEPSLNESRRLSQHELASRLSYFLWATMPDENLRSLADSGTLSDADVMEKQVRLMLADPRSQRFVDYFTDQWLDLSGLDRVAINPARYPKFDERLKPLMKKETQSFFAAVLKNDLSALNFLDSDFLTINAPLAQHYGISGIEGAPRGGDFELVHLPANDRRGGLLTQASFLMINSNGEDSHPIRRAVWLLDRLLGDPPAPPPPDVPELDSGQPDFESLTLKQQLEVHRTKSACNDCHRGIDPWGIAFESFDAVGLHRDSIRRMNNRKTVNVEVDDQVTLPGGVTIDGVMGMKKYLLQNEQDRFARSLTCKLLAYSLGRSIGFEDRDCVEELVAVFQASDYRLSDVIVAIAQSKAFQMK